MGFVKFRTLTALGLAFAALASCKTQNSSTQNALRNPFDQRSATERLTEPCKGEAIRTGNIVECRMPNEGDLIKKSIEITTGLVVNKQLEDSKVTGRIELTKRDAHPKHHGCIKGSFTVANRVPGEFNFGVFKDPGKSYPIWARLSNAGLKPGVTSDDEGDARGMAVKLIGVPGEKLMQSQRSSSNLDFLFVNIPFFVAKDIADYNAQLQVPANLKKNLLAAADGALRTGLLVLLKKAIDSSKMENPLGETYFSISSFQLGENSVNYRFLPCAGSKPGSEGKSGENKFRDAMAATLSRGKACYAVEARFLKIPSWKMVEDVSKNWEDHVADSTPGNWGGLSPEAKQAAFAQVFSDWTPVGRMEFPQQTFTSEAQMNFCENLSYNPSRTLTDMRPLGTLNRARNEVYEAIAKVRRTANKAPTSEPNGTETFP